MTRSVLQVSSGFSLFLLAACTESLPTQPDSATDFPQSSSIFAATAAPLAFAQLSAASDHTCGITTDNRLYCWGSNFVGQVGDGTTTDRLRPTPIATGLRFRQVSTGSYATCVLTTEYRAYCWGTNGYGVLGDGTETERHTPVAVVGSRQFRQLETYGYHTCAIGYSDGRAYCWGWNGGGQVGDGTVTTRLRPTAVAGTRVFRQVSTGWNHTCGLTSGNLAYCWGDNHFGQIGDRTEAVHRVRPTAVADGHHFIQLDAGWNHTCAVAASGRAFCWGNGRDGQLGNGRTYLSFWPRRVSGDLTFAAVTAGIFHSCGVTPANRAYCWGSNGVMGQLGDGTTLTQRLTPVAVAGEHPFNQISAGEFHTCARTETAAGYCWGYNFFGAIGDGTTDDRFTPAPVSGPM